MNSELITTIELLQNEIEQLEECYRSGVEMKVSHDILHSCRTKIIELKKELQQLELSLLDGLPRKNVKNRVV